MLVGEMTTLLSPSVLSSSLNRSNPNPLWANVTSDESCEDGLAGRFAEEVARGVGMLSVGEGRRIGDGEGVSFPACGLVWYQYNPYAVPPPKRRKRMMDIIMTIIQKTIIRMTKRK